MMDKHKLNLVISFAILLMSVWLIWGVRTWDSVGHLLSGCAITLIIWTLLNKKGPSNLQEFLIKGFLISYVATSTIWFLGLAILWSSYSASFGLLGATATLVTLVYIALLRSLFPVALSVIVYGIYRQKLKPWEILLSSWYASVFMVFAAYSVWWTLFVQPYVHDFYQSGAGANARDMLLVLLAFFVACVFTVVYLMLIQPEENPPP